MSKIKRFEIIDPTGRVLVFYTKAGGVDYQLQDDDRTLKVFVDKPWAKDAEHLESGGWIPCDTRLPESSGWFLCIAPDHADLEEDDKGHAILLWDAARSVWRIDGFKYHVTHWQPLPPNP